MNIDSVDYASLPSGLFFLIILGLTQSMLTNLEVQRIEKCKEFVSHFLSKIKFISEPSSINYEIFNEYLKNFNLKLTFSTDETHQIKMQRQRIFVLLICAWILGALKNYFIINIDEKIFVDQIKLFCHYLSGFIWVINFICIYYSLSIFAKYDEAVPFNESLLAKKAIQLLSIKAWWK